MKKLFLAVFVLVCAVIMSCGSSDSKKIIGTGEQSQTQTESGLTPADQALFDKIFPRTLTLSNPKLLAAFFPYQQIDYVFTPEGTDKVKLTIEGSGIYKDSSQYVDVEVIYGYSINGSTLTLINPNVIKNTLKTQYPANISNGNPGELVEEPLLDPVPQGNTMRFTIVPGTIDGKEVIDFIVDHVNSFCTAN
ncbi:MAG: hypothetical protein FWC57_04730 [Endomicrobia bacterium]|nr:hypothetical protein [Endomicrobiia bacterium]